MIFWVVVVLVALAAVAALLIPMLRQHAAPTDAAAFDVEVYRDQLQQIDRDRAEGLIGDAEAEAGRAEVGRRLLAADSRRKQKNKPGRHVRAGTGAALAVGILVPVCAVLLYSDLGVPGLPGFPYKERSAQSRDRMPELRILAKKLEERLKHDPTNVRGWTLLGRTYVELTEYDKAAKVFNKALTYDGGNAELRSAYGEALVLKEQGIVTPGARKIFETVLKSAPKNPRALFYLAVADEQEGKLHEALGRWKTLLEASPPDAPWAPLARQHATKTASALGLDPAKALPAAPPSVAKGPTAEDMAAAQSMTPEERQTMIKSMVQRLADRLKAKPDDLNGWLRLGRAYTVLQQHAEARDALAKAAALAPKNTKVLLLEGRAIRAAAGNKETPESLAVMRKVLAIDANNVEALWLVGMAEVKAGQRAAGLSKMQQALDHLPSDAPNRAVLVRRLDALKKEKN